MRKVTATEFGVKSTTWEVTHLGLLPHTFVLGFYGTRKQAEKIAQEENTFQKTKNRTFKVEIVEIEVAY
jgi:hypothetical protein